MHNIIPIVFITDDGFAMPTGVAITSLIANKKSETIYKIYIMIPKTVSELNRRLFLSLNSENASVELVECDTGHIEEYQDQYHVSVLCLLKFDIADMFPQYNKIIYLDGDILIRRDLSELYNIDLFENYIGAVDDMVGTRIYRVPRIEILSCYYNAGVLLLNSDLIRKEKLRYKLYKIKKDNPDFQWVDQDVWNLAAEKRVFRLPLRYNLQCNNFLLNNISIDEINTFYNTTYPSRNALHRDGVIIHLSSLLKTWIYYDTYMHREWMHFFKKSPYKNEKLILKKFSTKLSVFKRIKHIIKGIIKNLPIIKQVLNRYREIRNLLIECCELLKKIEKNQDKMLK